MKQKNIRVFEVEDFEKLKHVVDSKYELIKNYYFMLKEKNLEIQEFLKEKNLNYFVLNSDSSFSTKEIVKIIEKNVEKEVVKEIIKDIEIFDRVIRSGEEIEIDSHTVILNKINPGAVIKIKGSLFLFGENRGKIIVDGNFLFVRKNKGNILYNSEEIGEIKKDTIFYQKKKVEL